MTREQLLILVVVALVLLINFTARMLRRRVKGDVPRGMEPEAPQIPPRGRRPPPPVVEPRRAGGRLSTTPSRPDGPPDAARRRPRSPLRGRRAVRRGIVLMTVLGPCRALEPPDPRA